MRAFSFIVAATAFATVVFGHTGLSIKAYTAKSYSNIFI